MSMKQFFLINYSINYSILYPQFKLYSAAFSNNYTAAMASLQRLALPDFESTFL